MVISKIKLENFRSHEEFSLEFHELTTMIVGKNGCGKTSVLEAVYEGAQGKSFRAVDKEIVQRGKDYYRVEIFYKNGEKTTVFYDFLKNKKEFLTTDKKSARLPRKNKYPIILFEPNDLNLVGSSPSHKREFFDRTISQLTEIYSSSLSKFNKALRQRNEALKQEICRPDDIFSWNVMLAKYGSEISRARGEMAENFNRKITEVYREIAENEDRVGIEFLTEVTGENEYLLELEKNFQKDRVLGHTTFGTQKDDYKFLFNGTSADGTASRGEIRSIVIALKFIEAEMLVEKLGKSPIILLDDVFSELDEKRQKSLAKKFKNNQVLITSVRGVD